jgi:hypothetical protein
MHSSAVLCSMNGTFFKHSNADCFQKWEAAESTGICFAANKLPHNIRNLSFAY